MNIFWNLYARCYDSLTYLEPYNNMLNDVMDLASIEKGCRILDIGCGTGNLEKLISKNHSDLCIEAIDFSKNMLNIAKKKNTNPKIYFQEADLRERLPFDDCIFDIIIVNNVLYTLDSVEETTLPEILRVLKPNGQLIISDPKPKSSFWMIFGSHLISGGARKAFKKIFLLLGGVIIIPELLLVALANMIIDMWNKNGSYTFRSQKEWCKLLSSTDVSSTYANQNWLINFRPEGEINEK